MAHEKSFASSNSILAIFPLEKYTSKSGTYPSQSKSTLVSSSAMPNARQCSNVPTKQLTPSTSKTQTHKGLALFLAAKKKSAVLIVFIQEDGSIDWIRNGILAATSRPRASLVNIPLPRCSISSGGREGGRIGKSIDACTTRLSSERTLAA